jgi:hypothetical protein
MYIEGLWRNIGMRSSGIYKDNILSGPGNIINNLEKKNLSGGDPNVVLSEGNTMFEGN